MTHTHVQCHEFKIVYNRRYSSRLLYNPDNFSACCVRYSSDYVFKKEKKKKEKKKKEMKRIKNTNL